MVAPGESLGSREDWESQNGNSIPPSIPPFSLAITPAKQALVARKWGFIYYFSCCSFPLFEDILQMHRMHIWAICNLFSF